MGLFDIFSKLKGNKNVEDAQKTKRLAKWGAAAVTILPGLYALVTVDSESILKSYDLAKEWYLSTPAMTGSWSSRYPGDTDYVISDNAWLESEQQTSMELEVYDGKFDGVISTPQIRAFILKTPQLTDYFLLEGEKDSFWRSGTGYVYEVIGGKKYLFGVVNISLEDGHLVLTDKTPGGSELIPNKTTLTKREDAAFGERFQTHSNSAVTGMLEKFKELNEQRSRKEIFSSE